MIRIGLLFEYSTLNGGEHSILAAVDQLQSQHCEFVAIAPTEGPLYGEFKRRSLPVQEFTLRNPDGQRLPKEELAERLEACIQTHSLDIVHANSLTMGRHLGAVADQLSVPTTSHIRDIMSLSNAAVNDLNQHRLLIAVSLATREFHIQQGVDAEKIVAVYNGIDCDQFQPRTVTSSLRDEFGLPEDAILSATIGQICLRKAQNDLAQAAVLLKEECPNLHYLLIGERHSTKQETIEFEAAIGEVFEAAGMPERLHRLGYRSDIASLLNEVDLVIHPARQEPLGRVLLEAAASGVPIIATNVGGTPEIFRDGESALLIPPAEPELLAGAIKQLVKSPSLGDQLARNARRVIIEKFNIQQNAQLLATTWESVV